MGSYDNPPLWPAGHKILDTETAIVYGILNASQPSGGVYNERCFTRTTDQLYSSQTTMQSDNVFSFPVEANAYYGLSGLFLYTAPTAALFKMQWLIPSTPNNGWVCNNLPTSTTSTSISTLDVGGGFLTSTKTIGTSGGVSGFCPEGWLFTAAAGTCTFQHAQSVSNGTLTGMKAGSKLIVKRLA